MPVKKAALAAWIEKTGVGVVAKLLKVDRNNVNVWRRGQCLPKAAHMKRIMELTRGKLTPTTMVLQYFAPSNTKRWNYKKKSSARK